MTGIEILTQTTWPGAIVGSAIAIAIGWAATTLFKAFAGYYDSPPTIIKRGRR